MRRHPTADNINDLIRYQPGRNAPPHWPPGKPAQRSWAAMNPVGVLQHKPPVGQDKEGLYRA
ncbi:hypothetical protein Ssi02_63900 [Sinosporangium siamense]|uniref:Uncharacterized protein n=1 Tax=Sinosporangium siamense TaxID=1367973 RepID=A0A919RQ47_9ACTN|nr:hypothetical protein Ssi02_63900 [Sinosporangium siamense]